MRYELSDYEWSVIKPMLPNTPRGIPGWMTGAFSTASFGSCAQAHHGAICQTAMVPRRLATIASLAGGGLAFGTGLWMRWLPFMMRRCK